MARRFPAQHRLAGVLSAAAALCLAPHAAAQMHPQVQQALKEISWQRGPCTVDVGSIAQVKVPQGYKFTGAAGARRLLEAMKNPTSPRDLGLLCPDNLGWFVTFEFDSIGFVKDDEKNNLDANAILESLRKGNDAGNEERRQRGWPTIDLVGWEQPPRYDPQTNNLTWATRLRSPNGIEDVNYNTRLLGRGGSMSVNLVTAPAQLQATLPTYRTILTGYSYKPGHRYAEFRQGDPIAQYGLTALVAGGAAALAAKSGFLAKFGKVIIGGIVALFAGIGALFKKIFGGRTTA